MQKILNSRLIRALLLSIAMLGLAACSSQPAPQAVSVYPNPHMTPPAQPVPSPPEQEVRNASDNRQKMDYNQRNIHIRPAVSVGYGYHRGWRSHRQYHAGAGFYPDYW
ncbi:hypothetical protein FHQ26_10775 [Testudinibacter sp. TR-2022]|uniref:hypothetical protein n=1 Tax=Testudinibacter sp. TR-2022 TaxID=2585029 RepID=UPI0011190255|nr:hypothetical protein [Testudinibacter sp. TR-2022]TNH03904.1 hypothetical protein FHQ22_06450 [Pasteurellaceae bacterium Phil31]TNH06241.1 hypothetical protein FHQ26_10775 [Testudinibacter sp. TR-2022]TNH08892.1 hypothetical protein FHQ25_08830 [Testudinibacter sp. TR-2022]TNH13293.1 hypothetical protein FIA56_08030 [Testudinibacter sp. TR-2022]TNH18098.1 hypothetical protein FHQ23_05940 [Testudinibacter sp. TR-2022]